MSSFIDVRRLGFTARPPQNFFTRFRQPKPVPRPIVQDITFSLNLGDWVILYGAPGAGKTTLLRLLAGHIAPTAGTIAINGQSPEAARAHFIRLENSRRVPALSPLSTTQRLDHELSYAAASDAPLILLDDVADAIGVQPLKAWLWKSFQHRTVVITTRDPQVAQALGLPILLLHRGSLAASGTLGELASRLSAPRSLDAWIEGIRYDIFREIKKHPGVASVRLEVDGRYKGQRLRIMLKSARFLPALYDLVSRVPLIRIEEVPVRLEDVLKKL